jgi:hypothetical protein
VIIRVNNYFYPQTALIGLYSGDYYILVEVGIELVHNLDERHFTMVLTDTCHLCKFKLWNFNFKIKQGGGSNNYVFEKRAEFSLGERKLKETKVAEEYCWAITQAAG